MEKSQTFIFRKLLQFHSREEMLDNFPDHELFSLFRKTNGVICECTCNDPRSSRLFFDIYFRPNASGSSSPSRCLRQIQRQPF